jgi:hypothetical protein
MLKPFLKSVIALAVALPLTYCSNPVTNSADSKLNFSTKGNKTHSFKLPSNAQNLGNGVYKLKGNGGVEGISILHYAKEGSVSGKAKPPSSSGTTCYTFIVSGVKWRTVEPYRVDATTNLPAGLAGVDVVGNVAANISKWEAAAAADILGNNPGGNQVLPPVNLNANDDNNDLVFGSIAESGVIAVTNVWYIAGGPPQTRRFVEWDQIYDVVDFNWGVVDPSNPDPNVMDFENIATHELGHAAGLGDMYTNTLPAACSEATMWGTASEGETNKRDLFEVTTAPIIKGDVSGIAALY